MFQPERKRIDQKGLEVGPVRVSFVVRDLFLAAHLLATECPEQLTSDFQQSEIVAFQNEAKIISRDYAAHMRNCVVWFAGLTESEIATFLNGEEKFTEDLLRFGHQLFHLDTFKVLKNCTIESLRVVEAEWQRNLKASSEFISSITGIDFSSFEYKVVITHPSIVQGAFLQNKTIAWSLKDDWPNYNTVYIWHEILHDHFGLSDVSHSIIELIADNELRVRLNGGDYSPMEGHRELEKPRQRLMPYWREYLCLTRRDIFAFEERMLKEFPDDAKRRLGNWVDL